MRALQEVHVINVNFVITAMVALIDLRTVNLENSQPAGPVSVQTFAKMVHGLGLKPS